MKIFKIDSCFRGILLLAAGIVITFFPQFLSGLFYIVGAAVIIYNIILLIIGISCGAAEFSLPGSVFGILFGLAITAFPKLLSFGLPFIVGICLLGSGISGFMNALRAKRAGGSWLFRSVLCAAITVCGIVFVFNPFSVTRAFTRFVGIAFMIIGVVLTAGGWYRYKNAPPSSVIDVDSYTVHDDDNKRLK